MGDVMERARPTAGDTITSLFADRVAKTPQAVALYFKEGETWIPISWASYADRVDRFARALVAAGVGKGDRVALIGSNTPEWFVADMAIMTMGAVSVPVYATNSGEQIGYILNHSESRIFVVEEASYFQRIENLLDTLPQLERVVVMRGCVPEARGIATGADRFEEQGKSVSPEALQACRDAVTPDTASTFIYTSGTTGPPKAVILTHKNSVTAAWNVVLTTATRRRPGISCSYLSLAHVAERCINLLSTLLDGRTVYFMGGYERFAEYLAEIRPTFWAGVPRVWEKLYEGVMRNRDALPEGKRKLIDWALRTGGTYNWRKYEGRRISPSLRAGYKIARMLVITKLLRALGLDRAEIVVTGGAPTSQEVLDFFMSLGIWLQDVYGQTEGHGTTSFATKDAIRFGSAGKPYPLVEVQIADDGEILVRGDNVSPGYYKDPALTEETFRDGWLHSGDLGALDEDGFLWITGRKKDIIITSGGKNITPSKIEAALMGHPLIEHAVVVGDGRKFLGALLTLNKEEAEKICEGRGKAAEGPEDLIADPAIRDEIDRHVAAVNTGLARVEQVKKYTILPKAFSIEGGELTHILKIKRNVVRERYANEIEAMYS